MWTFMQEQVLGMKWLNALIGTLLGAIGLDTTTKIGASVQFFIYDTIKITFLLCVLIFLISYTQSFFPPERSRRIMGRFHGIGANTIGALLGTVHRIHRKPSRLGARGHLCRRWYLRDQHQKALRVQPPD